MNRQRIQNIGYLSASTVMVVWLLMWEGLPAIIAPSLALPTRMFGIYPNTYYQAVLQELENPRYSVQLVSNCTLKPDRVVVLLVHDIDETYHEGILYTLEREYGVRSSIYIRPLERYYSGHKTDLLKLQSQGFELGYHYDSLSKYDGNMTAAVVDFQLGLNKLQRDGFTVTSASSHGDPRNYTVINYWLYNNYTAAMKQWGVKASRDNIPFTMFVSDSERGFSLNPIQTLRNTQPGDTIVILTHGDYW